MPLRYIYTSYRWCPNLGPGARDAQFGPRLDERAVPKRPGRHGRPPSKRAAAVHASGGPRRAVAGVLGWLHRAAHAQTGTPAPPPRGARAARQGQPGPKQSMRRGELHLREGTKTRRVWRRVPGRGRRPTSQACPRSNALTLGARPSLGASPRAVVCAQASGWPLARAALTPPPGAGSPGGGTKPIRQERRLVLRRSFGSVPPAPGAPLPQTVSRCLRAGGILSSATTGISSRAVSRDQMFNRPFGSECWMRRPEHARWRGHGVQRTTRSMLE